MREIDFPFEGRKTIDALVYRLHKEPPYLYQGVPIFDRREEFDVLNYFTPDVMRAKYMELAQGDDRSLWYWTGRERCRFCIWN